MRARTPTLTGLGLIAALLTPPAFGQVQLLTNTGFENVSGNIPLDWTVSGGAESVTDGTFGTPAHNGSARMLHASVNYTYKEGLAEQTVAVAPGVYDLELSFFAYIRDDGGAPSSATGEILVDGEVVAAASKTEVGIGAFNASGYTHVFATWKGSVTAEITVRLNLIADGPGGPGWGIVNIDDVALWSRSCGTQHEVLDVTPNVINQPAANETLTITGTNLDSVTGVRLFRSPFDREFGEIEEIAGSSLSASVDGTSLTADMATSGAPAGFYDLIVEQAGCNARVVPSAIQVRDPAVLPNLLLNADFEASASSGNAIGWSGDYLLGPGAPTPSPTAVSGNIAWSNSNGFGGTTEDTAFWQEVPVSPGDLVEASGALNCTIVGVGASTCDITVNLWAMTSPSPTLIDSFAMDETTPSNRPTDDWVDYTISGAVPAGSPRVSVEVLTSIFAADFGTPVTAAADAFSLTVAPACDTQHRVWFAWPGEGLHNVDPTLTIRGGTQLDQVAAVSLMFVDSSEEGDEPEIILPGTINTQTPTELTATFPVVANMAQEGLYNLILEQPGCKNTNLEPYRVFRPFGGANPPFQKNVPPNFVDQFEVICANPTALSGVTPEIVLTDESHVDLVISGLEVDELDAVTLVYEDGSTTIPGFDLGVQGNDIVATFDLSGAPCGFYDLQAARADGCNDPAPLAGAFRLVKPGCNVLLNGDFEEEGPKATDATPVARWSTAAGHTASLKYDGSAWTIGDTGYNGTDNRGSTDQGGTSVFSTARVIQSQPAIAGVDATLTGVIYVGASFTTHRHRVLLRDGDEEGTIIDSYTFQLQSSGQSPWMPFTLTGRVTSNMVTVEWGHEPNPGGGGGAVATHVDELVLTYTALPCNEPFADADGDGDVDSSDFAVLQLCLTGGLGGHPPIPDDPAYCLCFDQDQDQDIDQPDFIQFANCTTGPDVLHATDPNPLCSDQP